MKTSRNSSEMVEEITPKTITESSQETPTETTQSIVKKRKVKKNNNLLQENSSEDDDDELKFKTNTVIEYFRKKSGSKTVNIDELDYKCANELAEFIDTDTIKIAIDTAFNRFSPKYKDDIIKTFRYCKPIIIEIFSFKNRGGSINGSSCKFQNAINDKQDTVTKIADKYGIIQSDGTVQDFKCQL